MRTKIVEKSNIGLQEQKVKKWCQGRYLMVAKLTKLMKGRKPGPFSHFSHHIFHLSGHHTWFILPEMLIFPLLPNNSMTYIKSQFKFHIFRETS